MNTVLAPRPNLRRVPLPASKVIGAPFGGMSVGAPMSRVDWGTGLGEVWAAAPEMSPAVTFGPIHRTKNEPASIDRRKDRIPSPPGCTLDGINIAFLNAFGNFFRGGGSLRLIVAASRQHHIWPERSGMTGARGTSVLLPVLSGEELKRVFRTAP